MPFTTFFLGIILLTGSYALIDWLIRQDGWLHLLKKLRIHNNWVALILWSAPWLLLAVSWSWESIQHGTPIQVMVLGITMLLTWKATTQDIDVVQGDTHEGIRPLLMLAVLGLWWSPAFLPLVVMGLSNPFGVWQHHATLPMRILQAVTAWLALLSVFAGTAFAPSVSVLVWFVLVIQISHYLITALAKGWLGPRWYSWVTENSLHHLAASAYSWGWARFLPWTVWRRVIGLTKVLEKPMQFSAFGIELLAPLALLHPWTAFTFCVLWSGFHLGVFALSGLLFWEWIGANLAVAAALWMLPHAVLTPFFGWPSVFLGCVFMILFPLRHKLWKPMPLGWWDTPLTQRIHWNVHGESGQVYALTNDFMCPHERLFGKVNGCYLTPVPVFTYHLGEVWKHDLRDAIRNAGPHLEELDQVRREYGILPRSQELTDNHIHYLKRFFGKLNLGYQKHVLPKMLRWLKAPGGQVFYWSDLPKYAEQEPITKVSLHYREEYFDGQTLRRLCNEPILDILIDETAAMLGPVQAPTPKAIDNFLLRYADGKLIDLPAMSDGYTNTDDGKNPAAAPILAEEAE